MQMALPRGVDGILRQVRRMLALERTTRIIIDEQGITLVRDIEEGAEVLPREIEPETLQMEFMMPRLELEQYPFSPEEGPIHALVGACHLLQRRRLAAIALVVPDISQFLEFIDIPQEVRLGDRLLGLQVLEDSFLMEKAIVLGAVAGAILPEEATHGVVMDVTS